MDLQYSKLERGLYKTVKPHLTHGESIDDFLDPIYDCLTKFDPETNPWIIDSEIVSNESPDITSYIIHGTFLDSVDFIVNEDGENIQKSEVLYIAMKLDKIRNNIKIQYFAIQKEQYNMDDEDAPTEVLSRSVYTE